MKRLPSSITLLSPPMRQHPTKVRWVMCPLLCARHIQINSATIPCSCSTRHQLLCMSTSWLISYPQTRVYPCCMAIYSMCLCHAVKTRGTDRRCAVPALPGPVGGERSELWPGPWRQGQALLDRRRHRERGQWGGVGGVAQRFFCCLCMDMRRRESPTAPTLAAGGPRSTSEDYPGS